MSRDFHIARCSTDSTFPLGIGYASCAPKFSAARGGQVNDEMGSGRNGEEKLAECDRGNPKRIRSLHSIWVQRDGFLGLRFEALRWARNLYEYIICQVSNRSPK